ncbi:hypothetical protein [Halorubrum halodurans]|uniref:Uncharacterized protein n=1 Tax=Halorubrum halodurans TaxID=1383851 RepID=A0A256IQT8_9EURY|nr:hypothetical protein [Halorubrum halodurans]OYR58507.1 hypothetical protein DJ70_03025 [Halorubrum halodurans]
MAFPTPKTTDVSNTNTDSEAADPEPESVYETLSDEHLELLKEYDMVVETYRGVRKIAATHLFTNPEDVSNSDIASHVGRSPLADHYVFYKDAKDDIKQQLRELRSDEEIPGEVSLPGYRDWNGEPDFDHEILSRDNAADEWGVNPKTFYDDEDEIYFPEAYEPPVDDDGNLIVWAKESGDEATDDEILSLLIDEADGCGEKTAENVLETLRTKFEVVHK